MQPAAPPGQVVIIQQTQSWGKHAMNITCHHCQFQVLTDTKSKPGPLGEYCLKIHIHLSGTFNVKHLSTTVFISYKLLHSRLFYHLLQLG